MGSPFLVIRLQWIHAVAGHERWKEEFLLLYEEERRVSETLRYWSREWLARQQKDIPYASDQARQGFLAYCAKQSHKLGILADAAEDFYRRMTPSHPTHS